MKSDNMNIGKDMENFEEDVSLNYLSNHGLGATNMGDEDDHFAGPIQVNADYLPDNSLFDEIEPEPWIWNLDIRFDRNDLDTVSILNGKRPSNKSLFALDNHIVEKIDLVGWIHKRKEEWKTIDTINWIISTGAKFGHSFGSMSPDLALPGKELLSLSKQAFIMYDRDFGEKLFHLLHEGQKSEEYRPAACDDFKTDSEDEVSVDIKSDSSDEDLVPNPNIKRLPGRPRILDKKRKEPRKKLWEFIRDALLNPQLCPRVICWDNYEEKTFRIVDSVKLSEIWGERNNKENSNMNYEKFSRAMRYYYKKDIFESVPSRRLIYKFGKLATGWETDCPNFDPNYYSNKVKSEP